MKPRSTPSDHDDLFRARLDQILDTDHPLIRLADKIDWDQIDERVGLCYADEGRPALSPRLMVGLHYLNQANRLSKIRGLPLVYQGRRSRRESLNRRLDRHANEPSQNPLDRPGFIRGHPKWKMSEKTLAFLKRDQ